MRKTTDLQPEPACAWKKRLQTLWSRFRLVAAITSPFWLIALGIQGNLGARLLGAAILLLIPVSILYSWRWVVYAVGILFAAGQRRKELKKGELNDAKKY